MEPLFSWSQQNEKCHLVGFLCSTGQWTHIYGGQHEITGGAPPPPVILLIVFWSLSPTFIVLSDEIHVRVWSSFFLFCYVRKILELDAPLGAQSLCKVWFHNFDNISLFHLMLVNFTSVSAKCQHGFIFVFCRFCCLNMNGRQTKIKYCCIVITSTDMIYMTKMSTLWQLLVLDSWSTIPAMLQAPPK